jgi:predicted Zn-dependent protease
VQHEHEADELGLTLTSLACFDIKSGNTVHKKLAQISQKQQTGLLDSHPASTERSEKLHILAQVHEEKMQKDPKMRAARDCSMYRRLLPSFGLGF